MFDFSFGEMLTAGAVALIVLGPERLPKVARTAGEWSGKIRNMAGSIKGELAQQESYGDLLKLKQDVEHAAADIRSSLHDATDGLPAWERLPEQRTPADFGLDDSGQPLAPPPPIPRLYGTSLHKQAMLRKRDLRPRYRPKPRLRSRK